MLIPPFRNRAAAGPASLLLMAATVLALLARAAVPVTGAAAPAGLGRLAIEAQSDADNDGLDDAVDPCPQDARNLCYGPTAIEIATGVPLRINANISAATCTGTKRDCNGDLWIGDFGFNKAGRAGVCGDDGGTELCSISGIVELFGCIDKSTEDLFRCGHWDEPLPPELLYSFNVENGEYLVNLFFANTFTGTTEVGERVFDILLEDVLVHDDFDQVAAAGGTGIAVVRSAVVSVEDGTLDLAFGHEVENPAVKAIEVLAMGECTGNADCGPGETCSAPEACPSFSCTTGEPLLCDPECERCEEGGCASICSAPFTRGRTPSVADVLFIVKAAIRLEECANCACDVDSSGAVTATDASVVLRYLVGLDVTMECPPQGAVAKGVVSLVDEPLSRRH